MWYWLATFAAACPKNHPTFFGLVPWYQYLTVKTTHLSTGDVCEVANFNLFGNSIGLILLAIVDDLLRIAGLVAVGFVIYGGAKYITSQGNPESAKNAQNTIIDALIGLVLAIVAVSLVTFIGKRLS